MEMLPMMPQPSLLFELLIFAHVALEPVLVPMDVGMYPQMALLRELHSADFTGMNLDRLPN